MHAGSAICGMKQINSPDTVGTRCFPNRTSIYGENWPHSIEHGTSDSTAAETFKSRTDVLLVRLGAQSVDGLIACASYSLVVKGT